MLDEKFRAIMLNAQLEEFKKYNKIIENFLNTQSRKLGDTYEKVISEIENPQEKDYIDDCYGNDMVELTEIFPNILRTSLFVTVYSFLEKELFTLCKRYKPKEYRISLDDLTGRGISKAQIYLKKVIGIDFPDQTSFWQNIIIYNYIRNFIVHKEGQLDKSDKAKKVKSFMETNEEIKLDNLGKIKLSKNFCPQVINTIENFLWILYKKLPKLPKK